MIGLLALVLALSIGPQATLAAGAPDTTITSGPSGRLASKSATFTFIASVAGSTFMCKFDGQVWKLCASPKSYSSLKQGAHTFRVKAKNGTMVDRTPAIRTFTVDTLAPHARGVATRVVIPSLGIDLPIIPSDLVVPGNVGFYPLCDVAMYMVGFVKPGEAGTTYIYAHGQDGMFAPLLHASKYNNGASMLGALVLVYTSDNMLHRYAITIVKRHVTDFAITRVPPGVHRLVLQTSEGWSGHIEKLQVAARPLTVVPASARAANPVPHPRVCLPH